MVVIALLMSSDEVFEFFTRSSQMALSEATLEKLQEQGIESPIDLLDFDKDGIDKLADNIRKAAKRKDADIIGAKSQKRLTEAAELVRFYNEIGREIETGTMDYETVVRDFTKQWAALKDMKDSQKDNEVPKISKSLPVIKWIEAFDDHLSMTIGVRNIPLSYVTRENEQPPDEITEREQGRAHSHGSSVVDDLVLHASHEDAYFKTDNQKVYHLLEQATRESQVAPTLKPFQRLKDGRGALQSIRNQYAGKDKWEAELRKQEEIMHQRTWKGHGNYSLEKFVALHRNAFVQMQLCAQHVEYQLPLEYTRVTYFLNAIKCYDPTLQAAIAQVRADERNRQGKRYNFEEMTAYLLPSDPVALKMSDSRNRDANVSEVRAINNNFGDKKGIGKTGVHFRFYKMDEYKKLSEEQKQELKEWRDSQGNSKQSRGKDVVRAGRGKFNSNRGGKSHNGDRRVSSASSRRGKKRQNEDVDSIIMALQVSPTATEAEAKKEPPKPQANEVTTVNTSALKSILKRIKFPRQE